MTEKAQETLADTRELALEAARLSDDLKAENIRVLDVRNLCNFTDYFVIATARSSTQLRALGHHVLRSLRQMGQRPTSNADINTSSWVALDYYDVVVHIMSAEARDYYRLETLWQDAGDVDWYDPERTAPAASAKAAKED